MAPNRAVVFALGVAVFAGNQSAAGQQAPEELRYSVLVGSFRSMERAAGVLERWTTPETPFYLVPVEVTGNVFFRVLAGLLPTRAGARGLMDELVRLGVKDSASDWDIRDAGLAFELGRFPSEAEASARVDSSIRDGVPAYAVPSVEGEELVYRVYAGGYESQAEASHLQGRLIALGLSPVPLNRTGLTYAGLEAVVEEQATQERAARDQAAQDQAAQERAAQERAAQEQAAQEQAAAEAQLRVEPPPEEAVMPPVEPPVEEPPRQEERPDPAQDPPPTATPRTTTPPVGDGPVSLFVGGLGTATTFAGGLGQSGPRGYGGAVVAGVRVMNVLEVGGHAGGEMVRESDAFGGDGGTSTVVSYSGYAGLFTPPVAVGGFTVSFGGRGGWGTGRVRVTTGGVSGTADLDTGVFVEPVFLLGRGSWALVGAYRHFMDDVSAADWQGSLGLAWGT